MRVAASFCALLIGCGCSQKNPYDPKDQPPPGPPPQVVGVHPDQFNCAAFLPQDDVAAVAMGEVESVPSSYPPAPGRPRPCHFQLKADPTQTFSIGFDCRDHAQEAAAKEIDGHLGEPDAKTVEIGKRAVDHSRAQVLFIDDDTPCAVWVTSAAETSRAALARMVAVKLVPKNAPMVPRAVAAKAPGTRAGGPGP